MTLRAASPDDAEALAEVHAAAFETPWSARDLASFVGARAIFALAAEADGRICAFILCRVMAGEAEVLTLAVRPDQRRRGLAAQLLAEAMALASLRAEAMFLEVAADNPGAIGLYQRAGFEAVGRRAGYYRRRSGRAVDALVMRRPLNT